jgi:hypothetical protein
MEIVRVALQGEITLVSSDYVKFEIEKIQDSLKRTQRGKLLKTQNTGE